MLLTLIVNFEKIIREVIFGGIVEKGVVTRYNSAQGVGYISDSKGSEIFFHYSSIADQSLRQRIREGLSIRYKVMKTRLGWEAFNVVVGN